MIEEAGGFDFFSTRLVFIDVAHDPVHDRDQWHFLDAFEVHVYGIFL
jgi:hypothetical protein